MRPPYGMGAAHVAACMMAKLPFAVRSAATKATLRHQSLFRRMERR